MEVRNSMLFVESEVIMFLIASRKADLERMSSVTVASFFRSQSYG